MRIGKAKFLIDKDGRPYVSVRVNGIKAKIGYEQKALEYNFIYLGSKFEERVPPVTLPADPKNGRLADSKLYGFTDEPEMVALYMQFKDAVDTGQV